MVKVIIEVSIKTQGTEEEIESLKGLLASLTARKEVEEVFIAKDNGVWSGVWKNSASCNRRKK